MSETPAHRRPTSRPEILLLVIAIGVGGWLRFVGLDGLGLSHFDEAVYTLIGAGVGYPFAERFAPPLFPLLMRGGFALLGVSDTLALALNGLFGTATIPLVWWVARRWYGPAAGVCAAMVAACSEFHATFSRTALTDTTFTFWFILSLWLASEMFERCCGGDTAGNRKTKNMPARRRVWPWTLALGLAAGAGLNTKYNGFLVVLLSGSPLLAGVFRRRFWSEPGWKRGLGHWAAAAMITAVLYLPWFVEVSSTSGYLELLKHQRGYADGLASWPGNLLTMLLNHRLLSDLPGRLGPAIGVLASLLFSAGGRGSHHVTRLGLVGCAVGLGFLFGDAAGWILGVLPIALRARTREPAAVVHAAWLVGLFLLTPLYHPYARLMMPLVAGGWIACGGLVASLLGRFEQGVGWRAAWGWAGGAIACCAAGLMLAGRPLDAQFERSSSRTLREACDELAASMPEREVVASLIRPPVLFYLGSRRQLSPHQDLRFLSGTTNGSRPRYLLVDGAFLRDNPTSRRQIDEAAGLLRERARVTYRPGPAVLLDDFGRGCASPEIAAAAEQTYVLIFYRVLAPRQADSREGS